MLSHIAELGRVHRHELSGALHGLMRVRAFTQDDAHIFMLPEQIKDQIKGVVDLIDRVYKTFGFEYHLELSTRPENSIGSDEEWEAAENGLREALEELGVKEFITSEVTFVASNLIELDEEQTEKVQNLIDTLEDIDDVQNVYSNLG